MSGRPLSLFRSAPPCARTMSSKTRGLHEISFAIEIGRAGEAQCPPVKEEEKCGEEKSWRHKEFDTMVPSLERLRPQHGGDVL